MIKINKTLRNALIFSFVFTICLVSDLLLKHFLFDIKSTTQSDYVVIGVRSAPHYSTTFLDFINLKLDNWINVMISLFIVAILAIMVMFNKSKVAVVGLSIMLAGTMGNVLDNIFLKYVRNVLYMPWMDRGTFNLADFLIIIGLPFALIPTLINSFKKN